MSDEPTFELGGRTYHGAVAAKLRQAAEDARPGDDAATAAEARLAAIWRAPHSEMPTGMVAQGQRLWSFVVLTVVCGRDDTHELGHALYCLEEQLPHAGEIGLFGGLRWDERGKAVGSCVPCAQRIDGDQGKAEDQQVGRKRLEGKLREMVSDGRHADRMSAS